VKIQSDIRIAYVILAHQYPEQLCRLVETLSCSCTDFFIHIDKGKDIKPFKSSLAKIRKGDSSITFVARYKSPWGSIGLVTATLNAFAEIVQSSKIYDYVITLSGQDYPLKKNSDIIDFFERNYGKNYISYFPCTNEINQDEWKQKITTDRLGKYHIYLLGKRYQYPSGKTTFSDRIFSLFFNKERKHLSYLNPYADSQWFCITINSVRYILNFVKEHPDFLHYHKYTYIPDEIFFQTILLNSQESLKESIVNDNLKYIDWSKPDIFHPMIFSSNDFVDLLNSQKMFARKFDANICHNILDMIDYEISK
jgi:Core-2/I-Branching enzyme